MNIPAILLSVMLGATWFMVRTAQKRHDFDFGNMLKDEGGKESATRLAILVALCMSSWALIFDTMKNGVVNDKLLMIYLLVWSGTKVAEKIADALVAKWGK